MPSVSRFLVVRLVIVLVVLLVVVFVAMTIVIVIIVVAAIAIVPNSPVVVVVDRLAGARPPIRLPLSTPRHRHAAGPVIRSLHRT